jgi:hypothetical protein
MRNMYNILFLRPLLPNNHTYKIYKTLDFKNSYKSILCVNCNKNIANLTIIIRIIKITKILGMLIRSCVGGSKELQVTYTSVYFCNFCSTVMLVSEVSRNF